MSASHRIVVGAALTVLGITGPWGAAEPPAIPPGPSWGAPPAVPPPVATSPTAVPDARPPAPEPPAPAVEPIPVTPPPSEVVPAGQTAPLSPAPVSPQPAFPVTPLTEAPTPPSPPTARLTPVPQMPSLPTPAPAAPPGTMQPQDPPTPAVRLQVRVPASVTAGKDLEYRIVVHNDSPAAAHHVRVRDRLPANARFARATPEPATKTPDLTWELDTLEPNASREIVLVVQPDGQGEIKNHAFVQFEHGQTVATQIARPALAITETGPSQASLNDAVSYRIEVRNTGGAPANAVVLRSTLPEGLEPVKEKNPLTWDLGTLAPGQRVVQEYQVLARKTGMLCNKAEATAAGGLQATAQSCVTVGEAKLHLDMTGPDRGFVNRPAAYQLTVSNPGTAPAANVTLTTTLPPRTRLVSLSDGGRLVGTQLQWPLGRLGPSERRTVQLTLAATETGEAAPQATANADRTDPATASVRTLFEGITGLTVTITARDNPVEVGTATSYLVTVRNQGDAAATHVGLAALVPEQMAVQEVRGQTAYRTEGQRVTFEPLASLPPRMEARYEIVVMPRTAGDVRFQVELMADQLSAEAGPVRRQQSTTIAGTGAARLQPVPR